MQIYFTGHMLIFTKEKNDHTDMIMKIIRNTKNDCLIRSKALSYRSTLEEIKKKEDRFYIIIDTFVNNTDPITGDSVINEDILNVEEIFNKAEKLEVSVIIIARDKKSLKEKIGKDIYSIIKDNIHTVITQK